MHHDYTHAMNVFAVTYAEISENFIQVGLPWVCWTWFAGGNVWNWLLPFTLTGYTTLVGHGGYKSSPYIAYFHPLIVPLVLVLGKHMLTASNHQTQYVPPIINTLLPYNAMSYLTNVLVTLIADAITPYSSAAGTSYTGRFERQRLFRVT